jgi:tetratricopeptide (TPR) repeat protein
MTTNNKKSENLHTLLAKIKVPAKTENEWKLLENELFYKLENQKKPKFINNIFSFLQELLIQLRPNVAIAVASSFLIFIAFIGILISFLNKSQTSVSVIQLVTFTNNTNILWNGLDKINNLSSNQIKFHKNKVSGTTIITSTGDSAIITLNKGNSIKIYPNTKLIVEKATLTRIVCNLKEGSILVKVNKLNGKNKFEIKTPITICNVIGTVFRVNSLNNSKTIVSVYEGKVKCTSLSKKNYWEKFVESGNEIIVENTNKPFISNYSSLPPVQDISILNLLLEVDSLKDALLYFNSTPNGAKVVINGFMEGKTPLIIKKPQGVYSLSVFEEGFYPWEKTLAINNTRFIQINAQLKELPQQNKLSVRKIYPIKQTEEKLATLPAYINALVAMSSCRYQDALLIFDSLWSSGNIDIKGRMFIMDKINYCYSQLGDFEKAIENLEEKYNKAQNIQEKGQILWEMATIKANCLGDYQEAEMALVEFLIIQPNALWAHSAYGKLAEIQYYLGKYKHAAETYKKHIKTFPQDPDIDRSIYNLACIYAWDLKKLDKAVYWYSKLITSFPKSKYKANAFFRRGECYMQLGEVENALIDFNTYLLLSPNGIWKEVCLGYLKKLKEA